MDGIQSNNRMHDSPAEMSFSALQQTADAEASHLGRSVAVTSQPVTLQLDNMSPPAYSEIDHNPPPPYLGVTRQNALPPEEERSSAAPRRRVEVSNDESFKCPDKDEIIAYSIVGVCVTILACSFC